MVHERGAGRAPAKHGNGDSSPAKGFSGLVPKGGFGLYHLGGVSCARHFISALSGEGIPFPAKGFSYVLLLQLDVDPMKETSFGARLHKDQTAS